LILLRKQKKQNSQIICFPEDFWFGPLDYYSDKEIKKITTLFLLIKTEKLFSPIENKNWFLLDLKERKYL
jgi:hypothetical protein